MLRINNGDYNLPTLAGEVVTLTSGHELPYDLYVFGVSGTEKRIFIDPLIPQAGNICRFLSDRNIPVTLGMNYNPRQRPAVAITRGMRSDENILIAASVIAFILFVMHETITLNEQDLVRLFGDQTDLDF